MTGEKTGPNFSALLFLNDKVNILKVSKQKIYITLTYIKE